jgi:hypothetical protein
MVVQAIGDGGLGIGTCARGVWFERGQFTIAEIPLTDLVLANRHSTSEPRQSHTVGQPKKRWLFLRWRGRSGPKTYQRDTRQDRLNGGAV